jgi:hypothetical protein
VTLTSRKASNLNGKPDLTWTNRNVSIPYVMQYKITPGRRTAGLHGNSISKDRRVPSTKTMSNGRPMTSWPTCMIQHRGIFYRSPLTTTACWKEPSSRFHPRTSSICKHWSKSLLLLCIQASSNDDSSCGKARHKKSQKITTRELMLVKAQVNMANPRR